VKDARIGPAEGIEQSMIVVQSYLIGELKQDILVFGARLIAPLIENLLTAILIRFNIWKKLDDLFASVISQKNRRGRCFRIVKMALISKFYYLRIIFKDKYLLLP